MIRDAKSIVEGDTYLDRVKEFVPAGNNPVYPDVLVTMRTLQQSLERCETQLHQEQERLGALLGEARTIHAALQSWQEDEESTPSKEDILALLDLNVKVAQEWLSGERDGVVKNAAPGARIWGCMSWGQDSPVARMSGDGLVVGCK